MLTVHTDWNKPGAYCFYRWFVFVFLLC